MLHKVYTCGQVAKVCSVAARTASKWIDSGQLRGWRIPGSQDRRVSRDALRRFLRTHGMSHLWDRECYRVVLVGLDLLASACLRELLASEDYRLVDVEGGFEAGLVLPDFFPDVMVLDLTLGRGQVLTIARILRVHEEYARTHLIALASEDETDTAALGEAGFSEVFAKPFDLALLAQRIKTLAGEE